MTWNPLHDAIDYHNRPDIDLTEKKLCDCCSKSFDITDMVYDSWGGVYVSKKCLPEWLKEFESDMITEDFNDFKTKLENQL